MTQAQKLEDLRRDKAKGDAKPKTPAKRLPSAASRTLELCDTREQENRAKPIVEPSGERLLRALDWDGKCVGFDVHYVPRTDLTWDVVPKDATKEERKKGPRGALGTGLCGEPVRFERGEPLRARKVCEACRVEASRRRAVEGR